MRRRRTAAPETIRVGKVINCTGPDTDLARVRDPLIAALRRDGLVRPDELGLGLDSDADGRLLAADGRASRRLFLVGPLRKGQLWENTAVPELRVEATRMAELLAEGSPRERRATRAAAAYPRGVSEHPVKPVERADRAGGERAAAGETAARAWWRRVPRVVTAPRSVFSALAETDDLDVDARSEPVLAITILAGMGAVLLTPAWGSVMDDGSVDGLVLLVVTFVAGLFYGAAGYFLLGLALWLGAKAVGVDQPFKIARQLVAFAALPLALSLVVVVPVIAIAFGDDWFRTGGDDTGTGRAIVVGIGLAFAAWSLGLVALGLRTTFRLPWRGVVGALALAAVMVGAFAVLPSVL